jgi:hypothetical protein
MLELVPMPFDWDTDRTAEEWKDVARKFARMWGDLNHCLIVDPNYIHWLSCNLKDSKLFRIDDPVLRGQYVNWKDRMEPRRHLGKAIVG